MKLHDNDDDSSSIDGKRCERRSGKFLSETAVQPVHLSRLRNLPSLLLSAVTLPMPYAAVCHGGTQHEKADGRKWLTRVSAHDAGEAK